MGLKVAFVKLRPVISLGLLGVMSYAVSEGSLETLSTELNAVAVFSVRVPCMLLVILVLFLFEGRPPPALSGMFHKPVLLRSAAFGIAAFFMTVAFRFTGNQTFTYLAFSLHPLFAAMLSRKYLVGHRPIGAISALAFAAIMTGLALYGASTGGGNKARTIDVGVQIAGYISSAIAGFAFASTNVASAYIEQVGAMRPDGKPYDALTLTYYAAMFTSGGCVLLIVLYVWLGGVATGFVATLSSNPRRYVSLIVLCAVASEIGGLMFTRALAVKAGVVLVSVLDLTITIFSVPIDLYKGKITRSEILGLPGAALALVLVAAAVIVIAQSPRGRTPPGVSALPD